MTTQIQERIVNDVPVHRMEQIVAAVQEEPEIAKFVFRAKNRWFGGGHNRATVKEFYGAGQEDETRTRPFVFVMDEPPVLLGGDTGANPAEYLLAALSGCMTTGIVYHAAARGIELEEVESTYSGDLDVRGFLGLDESVRNGFEKIRVSFRLKGDATEEQLDELVQLAKERSPVFDIVANGVPVEVERVR